MLDEELDRLPERLRGPVVLCWLDGLTRDEAVGRLGISLNTLKRRLEAGRELLRSRLVRRGVTPVVVTAAVLAPDSMQANVPSALANATLRTVAATKPAAASLPKLVSLVALAAVTAGGLAMVSATHAPPEAAPPPATSPLQATASAPDPTLPPGAVARFGSEHFRVPAYHVSSTALSRDGKLLAVGSNPVCVYEAATWKPIRQLPVETEHFKSLSYVAFSPGTRYLAAMNPQSAYVWDLRNGKLVTRFDGEEVWYWTQFTAFTPDGLLALSDKEKLRFFDPPPVRKKRPSPPGPSPVAGRPRLHTNSEELRSDQAGGERGSGFRRRGHRQGTVHSRRVHQMGQRPPGRGVLPGRQVLRPAAGQARSR